MLLFIPVVWVIRKHLKLRRVMVVYLVVQMELIGLLSQASPIENIEVMHQMKMRLLKLWSHQLMCIITITGYK